MEDAKIDKKKENVIVKKGLSYLIFKLIGVILNAIFSLLMIMAKGVLFCFKGVSELISEREKSKKLNSKLYKKFPDEEII